MSNIHSPSGRHGVDDEFNYNDKNANRCPTCWGKAKKMFFDPERARRRGITLNSVYSDVYLDAHSDGNSH